LLPEILFNNKKHHIMNATATLNNIKEIVATFAKAVQKKDLNQIDSLLTEDGEFNTQDDQLTTINGSTKPEFMAWFTKALTAVEIEKIEYDNCILCRVGNPVVLFNEGSFPAIAVDSSNKSMTGLMLDIVDDKIREIAFCYSFACRENKYQFECDGEEVKKLVAEGSPLDDAITIVLTKRGYKDIW
jgi:hypothetical protein